MTVSPSPDLLTGTVGECIVVLTRPEVRGAAEIVTAHNFETKDGFVWGRPGDFAIAYSPEGTSVEHYPIKREVFLGTYKVLGRVGHHIVAQRLIHVRRAWPIASDDAQFNFGADRGTVPIARGGWLYKSDDDDFGVVHRDVKHAGHLEVGSEAELAKTRWAQRHDRWTFALAALPPLLAFLALCAFAATGPGFPHWVAPLLIVVETLLLLGGAATVWTIKYHNWLLKACVETGLDVSRRFQVAAQLLGHPASHEFPGMSLWRAAQDDRAATVAPDAALEAQLKSVIATTLEKLQHRMHSGHARERRAEAGTAVAFVLILAGNAWLLFVAHTVLVELLAIWLPSVLSAIHSFYFRRRTTERIGAMKEFADQLLFIQKHLFASSVPATDPDGEQRRANLRLLCKVAAQYSQHEFMFALANEPQLPV